MSEYQPVGQGIIRARDNGSEASSKTATSMAEPGMSASNVHCRLMRRYEDTPVSWYLMTFLAMLAVGIFVIEYFPVYLPWYGLPLALSITALLFIPVGIVMAITNQHSTFHLICQSICGAVFPGRPVAHMVIAPLSSHTVSRITKQLIIDIGFRYALLHQLSPRIKFSSDLKLGHYMKIRPKLLFKVQMVATLISSVTQIGVLN